MRALGRHRQVRRAGPSAAMSAKAISEQTGKELLYKYICTTSALQNRFCYARVTPDTDWARLLQDHPWLLTQSLVVKPDQLIKRRGKLGLVGVNLSLDGVKSWLKPRLGQEAMVGKARGFLKNFLIEPFVPHSQAEEFYVCIYATRDGDCVLFHHEGGVDVGDVDAKAQKLLVGVDEKLVLASFISGLFNFYEDLYFTYLEINPLVVTKDGVYVLDLAAKVDATADYICKVKWGDIEFPPPFGREAYPEEAYIADLDAKSGASLKLTLLNPKGRIWTMVAGGGASVVYSDTICDLGGVSELANYGEYSGAPSEQQTYDYAKTILSLMTREKHPDGKILIIGGSIANFTNVAATFKVSGTVRPEPSVGSLALGHSLVSGLGPGRGLWAGSAAPLKAAVGSSSGSAVAAAHAGHCPTPPRATRRPGTERCISCSDTICDLGGVSELANYGEYSGAPSEQQTYDYAKTILSLMTREKHPDGKILIIGGSIANFTNVAATFKGIVRAIRDYQGPLKEHEVTIFVRRGGPNYQEGLRVMGEVGCVPLVSRAREGCRACSADRRAQSRPGARLLQTFLVSWAQGPRSDASHRSFSCLTGKTTGIPIHVFGTETHMTAIVGMALGHRPIPNQPPTAAHTANFLLNASGSTSTPAPSRTASFSESRADEVAPAKKAKPAVPQGPVHLDGQRCAVLGTVLGLLSGRQHAPTPAAAQSRGKSTTLFSRHTKALVWGMQTRAVQGMLDFDYVCSRDQPSVAAMVYPFTGDHKQKFYWGHKEILIPVFKNMADAMQKHPEVDVLINFASLRSAYDSTMETMNYAQIRTIAIIAEGIPEALTRKLIKTADRKGVTIIGPATVGGIKPGCFKIGNTGGMLDNILASKLYRPGSVAYVSRSGGMSNELNNIISRTTDGVFEGVAIGGDRYPGSTFMDHVLRYQDTPGVRMIVVLGEIGGTEEYKICRGIKEGRLTKPVVCWCIGTCATMFSSEVQFGHAGACANQASETAVAKNQALKEAGAFVPRSFDELGEVIQSVYEDLVARGAIEPAQEVPPPTVPMDYSWARELGLIRKPASFMTSICDERGQELIYAGMPITEVFREELGIGGVLGLLWFQRRLPKYSCQFIEMCLMVTADHGPAVSGAHNTIICARAGKDLVSSLTSGLLTIGDRFGGALDAAAKMFSKAFDSGMIPMEFVNKMKKEGKLIMGIGHRVKSATGRGECTGDGGDASFLTGGEINNPDMRVQILKDYVRQHFPATPLLDYALQVEKITTSKKPNLILNVDGLIGVAFVDMLRNCGSFTREEADEYIDIGALNGIFVLGRSMGFIGHYLDQKRLKQGLYRHPWDDISYVLPEHMSM
ncbi:ATP-citrate synthase [Fukomys damarensis]|uniref:ATP-citrate synthase n=1 Tax=Fukomys damarensis TaxID=885580 RepID=A0A091DE22_FUKDA|nr:ATP-citrate synthase [Fukomys damarensis]